MEERNELIIIKQLPIIEEHLKKLSLEIKEKVNLATSLVCNEDTVKDVKKTRAELTAQFNELETRRKDVKNKVLEPYEAFENIYKENVSDIFKNADIELKTKIDNVENELKLNKMKEVIDYFCEYAKSNNVDFVSWEQANIRVGLSDSMKSLKDSAKAFIDKILDDLKLIDTQEYKTEILVEYKQSLNVSQSITSVVDRFKKIEAEKVRLAELEAKKQEEAQVIAKIEEVIKPIEEVMPIETKADEIFSVTFKVYGTKQQLKTLKDYLVKEGYRYE